MNNEAKKAANTNGRILGIDFGSKRIGLALSDEDRQFAMPLSVIQNSSEYFAEIEKIVIDNGVKEIVLGESRDYKGQPNAILSDSIEFKKKLESRGFIVHFELEFMTSMQAERFQGKTDLTDASAAALILQSYLDKENSK
jgi:putative Holliday junction resolvase